MVVVVVHVVSYLLQLHYSRPILLLMSFASPLRCFFYFRETENTSYCNKTWKTTAFWLVLSTNLRVFSRFTLIVLMDRAARAYIALAHIAPRGNFKLVRCWLTFQRSRSRPVFDTSCIYAACHIATTRTVWRSVSCWIYNCAGRAPAADPCDDSTGPVYPAVYWSARVHLSVRPPGPTKRRVRTADSNPPTHIEIGGFTKLPTSIRNTELFPPTTEDILFPQSLST